MHICQTLIPQNRKALPNLWLISDERNDAELESALKRLPRRTGGGRTERRRGTERGRGGGSGFIYRHYHLAPRARFARFLELRQLCRALGHAIILADSAIAARNWGADGIYGAPRALYPRRHGLIMLAAAHSLREAADAARFGADACLLSPVFTTRSHVGAAPLGRVRFQLMGRLLQRGTNMPIIALGGMDDHRAAAMEWPSWAAIDGLS